MRSVTSSESALRQPLIYYNKLTATFNKNYIAGQDEAVASILKAIASWQLSRQAGCEEGQCHSSPKVLAFTGPTGVGKTETASKLVESFLARRSKVGNGYAQRPQGNSDYLSIYTHNNIIGFYRFGEKRNAVIVFDEIQKVAPGALDALVPLMDSNGFFSYPVRGPSSDSNKDRSYVEYFGSFVIPSSAASPSSSAVASTEEEYHTETISTSNVVFILISDIGKDLFWKLVLKYRDRSRIPPEELREEVRKLMEKQWRKLQFQRNIQEVIPFMPLERSHIRRIMAMKFQQYSRNGLFVKWMGVSIDSNVLDYFSASDKFIAYDPFEMTVVGKKDPAVAGNNGHAQNTEKVSCTDKANVCAMLADRPTVEKMEFAKYGARDIERVLGSSFKALLFQYMQPWRPYEIVHVGLISAMDESFYNEMRLLHRSQATDTIFLQWCRPVASMLEAGLRVRVVGVVALCVSWFDQSTYLQMLASS
eukprot:gene32935-42622_t